MMRLAALVLTAAIWGAGEARALDISCPTKGGNLLFHSCWGETTAELVLLPEDAERVSATDPERSALVVTGAYTGKDTRAGGAHNPVGLFIDGGVVVNPNLARMDGIVLIDPEHGAVSIQARSTVGLGEAQYDLTEPETRRAFARQASTRGFSVFQSHLLITNGALDVRPSEDAPVAVRRMLFTDELGWGLWQPPGAMTLYDAAALFEAEYGPVMALNLDMGSYDYCVAYTGTTARNCGVIGAADTGKLSNLLRVSYTPHR
jgi:hypothetical protein